jgi:phospholipase C
MRRIFAAIAVLACTVALAFTPAGTQARADTSPIQHVVVIYLENHTFDNVLGFWCESYQARCQDASGTYTGMPASVSLSSGAVVTPSTDPDVVPGVDHVTSSQNAAIDGGKMDGWWQLSGCKPPKYACISGYQPWQIPNISLLARDFAISDATFSMQNSPSWFGHLDIVSANSDGFTGSNPVTPKGGTPGPGWGCDSGKVTLWAPLPGGPSYKVPSCVPAPAVMNLSHRGAFRSTPVQNVPTIMDRLDAAGLPWRIYGEPTPTDSGPPPLSTQTQGYIWDICPSFAECLDGPQHADNVLATQFIPDASSGNLPAFSVVIPGGPDTADSCHNGFSMTACDDWAGQLVSSVMNGPDWSSTAIFVTWDDCGCFYDQVPPGVNPDGTPQGPRVPVLIISPYAKPGYTDTTPTTFAGILAYTEQNFGLAPMAANDAGAYAYANAFDYTQVPLSGVRTSYRAVPKSDRIVWSEAKEDS